MDAIVCRDRAVDLRAGIVTSHVEELAAPASANFEIAVSATAGNALAGIHHLQPINKILQRLLAGLIPIRALAVDYEVVELGGTEYIVHKDLNRQVKLLARPLEIVGVPSVFARLTSAG